MAAEHGSAYRERAERAGQALRNAAASPAPLRLAKRESNLFRDRRGDARQRLDLGGFDHVLCVDAAHGTVEAEALVPYDALVEATLAHGLMPRVVPQLKGITAGGAVAGVGIEASSFRHGLVHDTLVEADVLLADGQLVTCRADNDARELFLALPNSYGTLGYLLRLVLRTQPVKPFVAVDHRHFDNPRDFFDALTQSCDDAALDFVDGVVFARDDCVLNCARFVEHAQAASDYGFLDLYWHSLRARPRDALTTRDWLWRWDTDWFWCSRRFGLERRWLRRLAGRKRLNSRTYARCMRWSSRFGLARTLARLRGARHVEAVIQDVDLPEREGLRFLDFLLDEIGIVPIWVCPIRAPDPALPFTLYPLAPGTRYLNFGFWDTLERDQAYLPGSFNRRIETQLAAQGGLKSLYSDSFYTREQFDALYAGARYAELKARFDPQRRLLGLYEKCVLRL